MPPALFTPSAHHCTVASAHSPMLASTPDLAAKTPIFTGGDFAKAGAPANEPRANAPPERFRKFLRLCACMSLSLLCPQLFFPLHAPVPWGLAISTPPA